MGFSTFNFITPIWLFLYEICTNLFKEKMKYYTKNLRKNYEMKVTF